MKGVMIEGWETLGTAWEKSKLRCDFLLKDAQNGVDP